MTTQDTKSSNYRQAPSHGWTPWDGMTEQPAGTHLCGVWVKHLDGTTYIGTADNVSWKHTGSNKDVIAYRLMDLSVQYRNFVEANASRVAQAYGLAYDDVAKELRAAETEKADLQGRRYATVSEERRDDLRRVKGVSYEELATDLGKASEARNAEFSNAIRDDSFDAARKRWSSLQANALAEQAVLEYNEYTNRFVAPLRVSVAKTHGVESSDEAYLFDVKGYEALSRVLVKAYEQAAVGKGRERHANHLPFDQQPMQKISTLLDDENGMAFQAMKKIKEGLQLPHEAKIKELYGSIVYIAGMIIWLENNKCTSSPTLKN